METRVDPWLLWPRAVCVGALVFGLGVAGHVSADGLLPGRVLLATLLALSVLLSAPMLSRPVGRIRLVALLVGGQAMIHLVLTVTAGHRGDPGAIATGALPHPGLRSLPTVDGHRVGSLQDAYQGMSGQPASLSPALPIGHLVGDLSAHAPMMAAHAAAAVLVGLWLAYGERCLWTVLALTGDRVLATRWAPVPVPLPAGGLAGPATAAARTPRLHRLARTTSRRGPPVVPR